VTLQTAMQRRAGQVRDGGLERVQAIVERQEGVPAEGNDNRTPPITVMTSVSGRVQRNAERFGDPMLSSRWSRAGRKALDPDPQVVFLRDPVSQTARFMLYAKLAKPIFMSSVEIRLGI
jgi:hypothetical protein